jgi:exodeoxyribonuclease III
MKIITWNCNMAFRKKAHHILIHQPDILVVPECEHPDKLRYTADSCVATCSLWFGTNQNKGLGIFSYNGYRLKLIRIHKPEFRMIVPIRVSNPYTSFTLFAIWANNPKDPDGVYVEQVWKAIRHYHKHLKNKQTILAGDFNSNSIWDRKSREGNHSDVVNFLAQKGIYSTYHLYHGQAQGKEDHATHYLYRHKNKPYHLDYCFASANLAGKLQGVEIGDYEYWSPFSDHVPVIVSFKDDPQLNS